MIDVSFCADSMEELRVQMRSFLGDDVTASAAKATTAAPKATPAKVAAPTAPAEPAPAAPAAATTAPAVHPQYKEIADLVPKVISKHGRPAIVALFESFGVKNGKELKAEQYPAVLAKLKAELPV